eukprot:892020_1
MASTKKEKQKDILETVDIGIFYGIRVILTIGVVLLHTFTACYHFHLPSTKLPETPPPIAPWSSQDAFYNSLIGSPFVWLIHGANVFWFISGFLIAYQLYFLPSQYYPYFLFNRLLRLYPLFIIYIVFMYIMQTPGCTTLWDICRAILFIDNFWQSALESNCSGNGWTLSLEMHTCLIIMLLFYVFNPVRNTKAIMYAFCMIFVASWIASIYMFHTYCLQHVNFDNFDASLLRHGIDAYYPQSLRHNFRYDPFEFVDKNVYDPDHLSEEHIRQQSLYNNYLSSLYFPSYTQIGAGLFGAVSCVQLLSTRTQSTTSKYVYVLMFFVANFCLQWLGHMIDLWKYGHLEYFVFTDSVLTSVLLGSAYKCAVLCVFCGMNMLLRVNNKYLNAVLHNRITRFLDRYTYGVYLFHFIPIAAFTMGEEYRKSIHSPDGVGDGSEVMYIFGKSYGIAFVISVILSHTIENPFVVFRKQKMTSVFEKKVKKKLK